MVGPYRHEECSETCIVLLTGAAALDAYQRDAFTGDASMAEAAWVQGLIIAVGHLPQEVSIPRLEEVHSGGGGHVPFTVISYFPCMICIPKPEPCSPSASQLGGLLRTRRQRLRAWTGA